MTKKSDYIEILGININTSTEEEVLSKITTSLESNKEKLVIFTPNPELITLANNSSKYQDTLNHASFSLPDGIGVVLAAKFIHNRAIKRITGVDFMKSLCENVARKPVTVGFFGGEQGIAVRVSDCLREIYPELKVVYASDEWNPDQAREAKIDILFVALGSPKQELWIMENLDRLPAKVIMGVGGAFDMISGKVRRAPRIFRTFGLEWLWRLALQPWRWRRQLRLLVFTWLVIKQKISFTKRS